MAAMKEATKVKYAIVTGGGSGLGREFCLHLAKQGWRIAVVDIDLISAHQTLAEVRKLGGDGLAESVDVADFDAWQALIEKLRGMWPRLDLLINNAGICGAGPMGEYSFADFRRILDVNLMGVVNGCQVCIDWLKQSAPETNIVNVASLAAAICPPDMAAYNTAKAGVVGLSETLHGELKESGVGVTVVLPGFFESQLVERGNFEDETLRKIARDYIEKAEFTATDVVKETMCAIERHKLYVIVGRRSRIACRLKRLVPVWFLRRIAGTMRNDYKRFSNEDLLSS
jgi:NAD(P)-dependent dehydrogenase (short-subunit alcohol dehydrogenase family)